MKKQGWSVGGNGADLRIYEKSLREDQYGYDSLVSYAEAKETAMNSLRDHVEPYLMRIAQLESDQFEISGKLPPFKAWQRQYDKIIVVAKTKRRAIELCAESRYGFNEIWALCQGDWWYKLAHEEGLWAEKRDGNKMGTGIYYRSLSRNEAEEIAERHMREYREMPLDTLIALIGHSTTITEESSHGTPYQVTTKIEVYEWQSNQVSVQVEVDDCLGWQGHYWDVWSRGLPQVTVDWVKEGF
jgi:hypothetical protein